jgi:muramoyltetrapeptide carboxypeptidase
MDAKRRQFLAVSGAALAGGALTRPGLAQERPARTQRPGAAPAPVPAALPPPLKPPRLRPGDTVGLVGPASATFHTQDIEIVTEVLAAFDLKARPAPNLLKRYGYLGGRDDERAADVDAMFADPEVKGVFAVRGGWGCARVLPHLDYELIRRNPKALIGFSDITALHLGIHARTGLVSFHAPTALATWPQFSADYLRRVVLDGEAVLMQNPKEPGEALVPMEDRVRTITPGLARGRLLGGNLTVLTALVGTPYLPAWDGAILFLEDTNEEIYRVDRMLTQLALAGILKRLAGVVFGKCTRCDPGDGSYGSLTLEEVLNDHVKPLGVPSWEGAMIGHVKKQWTVPIGAEVEIDAGPGTIRMLEPAVSA